MQFLERMWRSWKKIGQFIGDMLARVVLTLFYFTLLVPFGLGVRLFGDPLGIKQPQAAWLARETRDRTIDDGRSQA